MINNSFTHAQQVADLLDRNQDNIITVGEVVVGFGEILNYQCK